MKIRLLMTLFLIMFFECDLFAQNKRDTLTNESIVSLVKLGFDESVIITKISTSYVIFDTSIKALDILSQQNISSTLINSMMLRQKEISDERKVSGIYEIGDIYPNEDNAIGIVYKVSHAGRKGSIISIDEGTDLYWMKAAGVCWGLFAQYGNGLLEIKMEDIRETTESWNSTATGWDDFPAFEFCEKKNNDEKIDNPNNQWHLPSINDWSDIMKVVNQINKKLALLNIGNDSNIMKADITGEDKRYWTSTYSLEELNDRTWVLPYCTWINGSWSACRIVRVEVSEFMSGKYGGRTKVNSNMTPPTKLYVRAIRNF